MSYATPAERLIARNVSVALVTEPLADKPGCTTRWVDCAPSARLEYFVVGGLNTIWAFHDLAEACLATGSQPASIFHFAAQAQHASTLGRGGGKITFGQTLLLVPLVASHAVAVARGKPFEDVEAALDGVDTVLAATSTEDVADLEDFCHAALAQSRLSNEARGVHRSYPNPRFRGQFVSVLEAFAEARFRQLLIVREMAAGYPRVRRILEGWHRRKGEGLLSYVELAYPPLFEDMGRVDVTADLLAVGMYLILCSDPTAIFFP